MKAAVHERYGAANVQVREVERPEPDDDGVLVRVRATSVNRADWYSVAGKPLVARPMMGGTLRPKEPWLGGDFAGVVEAVGSSVADFAPGDEVFGMRHGSFAEYVCVPQDGGIARKPANLTFEEAAAVPLAGLTALQAARHGNLEPGQKVLVNGASGGVGTFAVQIAKALGGDVTAVCSARNVELVRSLGADRVIDYMKEDVTELGQTYDAILDAVGKLPFHRCRSTLRPGGSYTAADGWSNLAWPAAPRALAGGRVVFAAPRHRKDDVLSTKRLIESGAYRPVIDRTYRLDQIVEATRYVETGQKVGNVVISVSAASAEVL